MVRAIGVSAVQEYRSRGSSVRPAIVDTDRHEAVSASVPALRSVPQRRRLSFAILWGSESLCTEWHDVNSVDVVGLAFDTYLYTPNE
jgi:hypothetical protein